jgi:hypothetical protein
MRVVVVVLPLEPVMATMLAFEEARGEFELADDGQAEGFDLDELRRVERDAGADDDEVLAAEGEQAVAAGFDHDAVFEEGGDFLGQGGGGAHVGDGDLGAAMAQKQGRGETGFAQAYDQNFLAFQLHPDSRGAKAPVHILAAPAAAPFGACQHSIVALARGGAVG